MRISRNPKKILRACDGFTEVILYFMVVFTVWAFGTTPTPSVGSNPFWGIWTMNAAGFLLGTLLMIKIAVRWYYHYVPNSWSVSGGTPRSKDQNLAKIGPKIPNLTFILASLNVILLLYCFTSAINARATFSLWELRFNYRDQYIPWLPHSYDAPATWLACWQILGFVCAFWAIRDWLLNEAPSEQACRSVSQGRLPPRLTRLLWIICINGALVGFQGILQQLSGTTKLLWLVQPRFEAISFGPYTCSNNAAQYFNLVWPLGLGFWWILLTRRTVDSCCNYHDAMRRIFRPNMRHVHWLMVPCILLMASCPIFSYSRGGALIELALFVLAVEYILHTRQKSDKHWSFSLSIFLIIAMLIMTLGYLGIDVLLNEFQTQGLNREQIYANNRLILDDFTSTGKIVLGSGPRTYRSFNQFIRNSADDVLQHSAHDDWFEILIEFGIVGTMVLLCCLACIFLHWFLEKRGAPIPKVFGFTVYLALIGCLVHAKYDFPFKIHSIDFYFVMICAILFSSTARQRK
jgi:hypothetical protein